VAAGFHFGLWYQQVKGQISIQLDNITKLQHSNIEQTEANGTNQTKWLNSLKIPVTSQTKLVLVPDIPLFFFPGSTRSPSCINCTSAVVG
jgi:hypothetical protein